MMLLNKRKNAGAQDMAVDLPVDGIIAMLAKKICDFLIWIATADSLLALMYNNLA